MRRFILSASVVIMLLACTGTNRDVQVFPSSTIVPSPAQTEVTMPTIRASETPLPLPSLSSPSQQVPTNAPTADLTPLTSVILTSDEINASDLLKVDDGLEISDRSDCLPIDCAISVWDILQQESLALTVSNSTLQPAISLRSFETPGDANSSAVKIIRENGGHPGNRMIQIPIKVLPEQSWAYAEDGRFFSVLTVYGNIKIGISLSQYTGGINESEKAVALLANLAKLQIDKLMLLNKR